MQAIIAARASKRLGPILARLGTGPRPGERLNDAVLRTTLVSVLGTMGEPAVLAEAKRLFDRLDADKAALDGPMRNAWLGILAHNADKPVWDKLHRLARTAETPLIKAGLYDLLGQTRDKALAQAALKLALTGEPGATQSASIISSVASLHPDLAVDFVLANIDQVEGFLDASSRSRYVPGLAAGSRDPAMVAKLSRYAKDRLDPQARKPVERAIAAIQVRLASDPRIKAELRQWFASAKPL
jgi:hypothetical protein